MQPDQPSYPYATGGSVDYGDSMPYTEDASEISIYPVPEDIYEEGLSKFDDFSTWEKSKRLGAGGEQTPLDPLNAYKEYSDYVRGSLYESGVYSKAPIEWEKMIRQSTVRSLASKGVAGADDPNFQQDYFNADSDTTAQAQQILDFLDPDQVEDEEGKERITAIVDAASKFLELGEDEEGTYTPLIRQGVSRVRKTLLDAGDLSAARLYNDEGESYVALGNSVEALGTLDAVKGSRRGGIGLSDLYEVEELRKPVEGLGVPRYQLRRNMEVYALLEEYANNNNFVRQIIEGETDKQAGDRFTGLERLGEGAQDLIGFAATSLTAKLGGAGSPEEASYNRFMQEMDERDLSRKMDYAAKVEFITKNLNLMLGPDARPVSQEDVERSLRDLALRGAMSRGSDYFKVEEDATNGVARLSTGEYALHSGLVADDALFNSALSSGEYTENQKAILETTRDALRVEAYSILDKTVSSYDTFWSDELSDDWERMKIDGLRNNKPRHEVAGEFLNKHKDYWKRATALYKVVPTTIKDTLLTGALAIGLLTNSELATRGARNGLLKSAEEMENRRAFASLMGDEFGLGLELAETTGPMLLDMAATTMLSLVTTPIAGAGGAAYLSGVAAKQGIKLSIRQALKAGIATSLRQLPKETLEQAGIRLTKAGIVAARGGLKEVSTEGLEALFKAAASKAYTRSVSAVAQVPAMFIPAASRSGSSAYITTFRALKDQNYSDEEAHRLSVTSGLVSGLITGSIVVGFHAIGAGGLESAAVRGATPRNLIRITRALGKTDAAMSTALKDALSKQVSASIKSLKGSGFLRTVAGGMVSEAPEEAIDQFINGAVQDAFTNTDTPVMESLRQALHAGLLGGILGGAAPAVQAGSARVRTFFGDDTSQRRATAQYLNEFINNVTKRLEDSGSPMTAETVADVLLSGARVREELKRQGTLVEQGEARAKQQTEALRAETQKREAEAQRLVALDEVEIKEAEARIAAVEEPLVALNKESVAAENDLQKAKDALAKEIEAQEKDPRKANNQKLLELRRNVSEQARKAANAARAVADQQIKVRSARAAEADKLYKRFEQIRDEANKNKPESPFDKKNLKVLESYQQTKVDEAEAELEKFLSAFGPNAKLNKKQQAQREQLEKRVVTEKVTLANLRSSMDQTVIARLKNIARAVGSLHAQHSAAVEAHEAAEAQLDLAETKAEQARLALEEAERLEAAFPDDPKIQADAKAVQAMYKKAIEEAEKELKAAKKLAEETRQAEEKAEKEAAEERERLDIELNGRVSFEGLDALLNEETTTAVSEALAEEKEKLIFDIALDEGDQVPPELQVFLSEPGEGVKLSVAEALNNAETEQTALDDLRGVISYTRRAQFGVEESNRVPNDPVKPEVRKEMEENYFRVVIEGNLNDLTKEVEEAKRKAAELIAEADALEADLEKYRAERDKARRAYNNYKRLEGTEGFNPKELEALRVDYERAKLGVDDTYYNIQSKRFEAEGYEEQATKFREKHEKARKAEASLYLLRNELRRTLRQQATLEEKAATKAALDSVDASIEAHQNGDPKAIEEAAERTRKANKALRKARRKARLAFLREPKSAADVLTNVRETQMAQRAAARRIADAQNSSRDGKAPAWMYAVKADLDEDVKAAIEGLRSYKEKLKQLAEERQTREERRRASEERRRELAQAELVNFENVDFTTMEGLNDFLREVGVEVTTPSARQREQGIELTPEQIRADAEARAQRVLDSQVITPEAVIEFIAALDNYRRVALEAGSESSGFVDLVKVLGAEFGLNANDLDYALYQSEVGQGADSVDVADKLKLFEDPAVIERIVSRVSQVVSARNAIAAKRAEVEALQEELDAYTDYKEEVVFTTLFDEFQRLRDRIGYSTAARKAQFKKYLDQGMSQKEAALQVIADGIGLGRTREEQTKFARERARFEELSAIFRDPNGGLEGNIEGLTEFNLRMAEEETLVIERLQEAQKALDSLVEDESKVADEITALVTARVESSVQKAQSYVNTALNLDYAPTIVREAFARVADYAIEGTRADRAARRREDTKRQTEQIDLNEAERILTTSGLGYSEEKGLPNEGATEELALRAAWNQLSTELNALDKQYRDAWGKRSYAIERLNKRREMVERGEVIPEELKDRDALARERDSYEQEALGYARQREALSGRLRNLSAQLLRSAAARYRAAGLDLNSLWTRASEDTRVQILKEIRELTVRPLSYKDFVESLNKYTPPPTKRKKASDKRRVRRFTENDVKKAVQNAVEALQKRGGMKKDRTAEDFLSDQNIAVITRLLNSGFIPSLHYNTAKTAGKFSIGGDFGFDGNLKSPAWLSELRLHLSRLVNDKYPQIAPYAAGDYNTNYANSTESFDYAYKRVVFFKDEYSVGKGGFKVMGADKAHGAYASKDTKITYQVVYARGTEYVHFNNDPLSMAAAMADGYRVRVPADVIESGQLNPAFIVGRMVKLKYDQDYYLLDDVKVQLPRAGVVRPDGSMATKETSLKTLFLNKQLVDSDRAALQASEAETLNNQAALLQQLLDTAEQGARDLTLPDGAKVLQADGTVYQISNDAENLAYPGGTNVKDAGVSLFSSMDQALAQLYDYVQNGMPKSLMAKLNRGEKRAALSEDAVSAIKSGVSVELALKYRIFAIRSRLLKKITDLDGNTTRVLWELSDKSGTRGTPVYVVKGMTKGDRKNRIRAILPYFGIAKNLASGKENAKNFNAVLKSMYLTMRQARGKAPADLDSMTEAELLKAVDDEITATFINPEGLIDSDGSMRSPKDLVTNTIDRVRQNFANTTKVQNQNKLLSLDAETVLSDGEMGRNEKLESEAVDQADEGTSESVYRPTTAERLGDLAPEEATEGGALSPAQVATLEEYLNKLSDPAETAKLKDQADGVKFDERGVVVISDSQYALYLKVVSMGLNSNLQATKNSGGRALIKISEVLGTDLTESIKQLEDTPQVREALQDIFYRLLRDEVKGSTTRASQSGSTQVDSPQVSAYTGQLAGRALEIASPEVLSTYTLPELFSLVSEKFASMGAAYRGWTSAINMLQEGTLLSGRTLQDAIEAMNVAQQYTRIKQLALAATPPEGAITPEHYEAYIYLKAQLEEVLGRKVNDQQVKNTILNIWNSFKIVEDLAVSLPQQEGRALAYLETNMADVDRLGLESNNPESLINTLNKIAEESDNPNHRMVAKLLLEDEATLRSTPVHLIVDMANGRAGDFSVFADGRQTVRLNLAGYNNRGLESVLLEELLHARFTSMVNVPMESLTPEQQAARKRLDNLRKLVQQRMKAEQETDPVALEGVKNVQEFISAFLLDPEFQGIAKDLEPDGGRRSFFARIIEALSNFFGRFTGRKAIEVQTAMSDILNLARQKPDRTRRSRDPRHYMLGAARQQLALEARQEADTLDAIALRVRATNAAFGSLPSEALVSRQGAPKRKTQTLFASSTRNNAASVKSMSDATAKQQLLMRNIARDLHAAVPPGTPMVVSDATASGRGVPVMAFEEGVIYVNEVGLLNEVGHLSPRNASQMARALLSEEVAHSGSYNALTNAEVDAIVDATSDSEFASLVSSYYGNSADQEAARERLSSEDEDVVLEEKRRLIEEKLRVHAQRVTRGFSTEEDRAFYRTNPGLMRQLKRYFVGMMRRMAALRKLNKGSGAFNSAVTHIYNELALMEAGYRYDNLGMGHWAFDPQAPDEWLRGYSALSDTPFADIKKFTELYGDATLTDEQENRIVTTLFSGEGTGSATALDGKDPDGGDIKFERLLNMLEVPMFYAGNYTPPKSTIGKALSGELDPRLRQIAEHRKFFDNAVGNLIRRYHREFTKIAKQDFPNEADIPHKLINEAVGNVGVAMPSAEAKKRIEDEYTQTLKSIESDPTLENDQEGRKAAIEKADKERIQKLADAAEKSAEVLRNKSQDALNKLAQQSPRLAAKITEIRTGLIEPLSRKVRELYKQQDTALGVHIDAQMGIYITRAYKAFNEAGYLQAVIKNEGGNFTDERNAAIEYFNSLFKRNAARRARAKAIEDQVELTKDEIDAMVAREYREAAARHNQSSVGEAMMLAYLRQYVDATPESAALVEMSKDPSIKEMVSNLKSRKDIPEVLQKLLGVYDETTATDNLLRTLSVVGAMASNQAALNSIRDVGIKEGFLVTREQRSADPDRADYVRVRTTNKDSVYDPLGDLYGPPELVDGLLKTFNVKSLALTQDSADVVAGKLGRALGIATGASMSLKTLGSVGFYLRNYLGNYFFGLSQGYFAGGAMEVEMYKLFSSKRKQLSDGEVDADISYYESLGLIGEDVRMGIIRDLLKGKVNLNEVEGDVRAKISEITKKVNKGIAVPLKVQQELAKVAGAIDAAYKIAYFKHELKTLRKAKEAGATDAKGRPDRYSQMTDAQLEQEAASKVRRTSQGASQTPPLLRKFTQSPLGSLYAPFIRFRVDAMVRIPVNTVKIAVDEIKDTNPVIRKRGFRRITGFTVTTALLSGAIYGMARALSGIDLEEEESLREGLPPYLQGHSFLYIRDAATNKLTSWDLTYLNPFATAMDPFLRMVEKVSMGKVSEGVGALFKGYLLDGYLDDQILAGAVRDAVQNENRKTGDPIREEDVMSPLEMGLATANYIYENAVEPRLVKDFRGASDEFAANGGELGELSLDSPLGILFSGVAPVRPYPVDPDRAFMKYLSRKRQQMQRIRGESYELAYKEAMSDDDIRELADTQVRRLRALNEDIRRVRAGFEGLGVTRRKASQLMKSMRFGQRRVNMLDRGIMERPVLSPPLLEKIIQTRGSSEGYRRARLWEEGTGPNRFIRLDDPGD